MKLKFTCILTTSLVSLCGTHNPQEEKIKKSLQNAYCEKWEYTKNIITHAITKGVSTVDVQEYTTWGYTPLCEALEKDDQPFVEFLLQKGANADFEVEAAHSNKPIFFAKSVETIKSLQAHGANLKEINQGKGVTKGMNLLQKSISCYMPDDKVFDYLVEQGLVPQDPGHRENLWYSLLENAHDYPEQQFINRAQKLHKLGISPNAAIGLIEKNIQEEAKSIEALVSQKNHAATVKNKKQILEKLQKFLHVMTTQQTE